MERNTLKYKKTYELSISIIVGITKDIVGLKVMRYLLYIQYLYTLTNPRMVQGISQYFSQQRVFWLRINTTIQTIFFLILLFFIPFLLGGPQLLVGSIINFLLIIIALKYKNYLAIVPMLMLPSIATSLRGMVFWPFTIFIVYMMPAIWIGNFILIYAIQHIKNQRISMLVWWVLKTIFLFIVAYILVQLWVLPTIFLKAMGVFQLVTVMIAGVVALGFIKVFK